MWFRFGDNMVSDLNSKVAGRYYSRSLVTLSSSNSKAIVDGDIPRACTQESLLERRVCE